MKNLKRSLIENGHDYGVRAQILGTALVTGWEFFTNKNDLTNTANQTEQLVSALPPEDYAEYIAIASLTAFGPIFYWNKMMAHCHPDKEKRDFYKNNQDTTATQRRNAYITSGIALMGLSAISLKRGKIAAGLTFMTGSVLNLVTAFENQNLKEEKAPKKPFRKSGYGYFALNLLNIGAGIAFQNFGVIGSNSLSAVGALMIADSEPKKQAPIPSVQKTQPLTP